MEIIKIFSENSQFWKSAWFAYINCIPYKTLQYPSLQSTWCIMADRLVNKCVGSHVRDIWWHFFRQIFFFFIFAIQNICTFEYLHICTCVCLCVVASNVWGFPVTIGRSMEHPFCFLLWEQRVKSEEEQEHSLYDVSIICHQMIDKSNCIRMMLMLMLRRVSCRAWVLVCVCVCVQFVYETPFIDEMDGWLWCIVGCWGVCGTIAGIFMQHIAYFPLAIFYCYCFFLLNNKLGIMAKF